MTPQPEFSRPVPLETLGHQPHGLVIEAEAEERLALARRFGLISVERLSAEVRLTRDGEQVTATGSLIAAVIQSCVATGEPVETAREEEFRIEFRPYPEPNGSDEEIELGKDELDIIFYEGSVIDLGEAVSETLSLSLDPYPRCQTAKAALRQAGVRSEREVKAETSPFAVLAALTNKLKP